MEARSLKFVAEACGGELRRGAPDRMVTRVCTDSRQAAPGDLFVALAGERHDAHDHLPEVARRGAMAVLAERAKLRNELPSCAVIAVESTRAALGRLAARYRAEFSPAMCAVGGSNGKTSTKELIASVLRQKLPTVWNEASFNNDIGVPLTLLKLDRSHRAAVVEAGTNHPGELAPLLRMISPRFGVVTNIGREHLEFFGDLAGVAREEGALAEALPADGVLIVNGDDEWADALARRSPARVVRVGLGERNDFRAAKIRVDQDGTVFEVRSPQARLDGECRIRLLGRAQSVNALFAVALAAELGLGREEIGRGLAECAPAKMRLQLWQAGGVQVLDDAYNANADSMRAALDVLGELPCAGRRVAVLGDMAELGDASVAAHQEVGAYAARMKVDRLFAVGRLAANFAASAREHGLADVVETPDVEEAARRVGEFVKADDLVLLKASRAMRLERIGEALKLKAESRKQNPEGRSPANPGEAYDKRK